ncbi:MAG: peptidyl-prolyl cis-trans isomerase [Polyangiales bacterium]
MVRLIMVAALILGIAVVPALADEEAADDDARRARVFAKIGDVTITVGDLEDRINERSPYARKRFEDPNIVREFADDRVRAELLLLGAEKRGYENDPDVAAFLDRTIIQMFMRQEIEEAADPNSITEAQIEAYYGEHPEEFSRPEMRRASHILVGSRQEAQEIIAELAKGTNKTFGTIAKQQSLDTETRLRGGDLLYFTREGVTVGSTADAPVDAALVEAAFALGDKGQVTKTPIDLGDDKWSVLRLSAIRPARVESLEDAQGGIRRRMWREDRKSAVEELVARLRVELEPAIHADRMKAIVLVEEDPAAVDPANP